MNTDKEETDNHNPCDDLRRAARELLSYYRGNIKIEINVDKVTENVILNITEYSL